MYKYMHVLGYSATGLSIAMTDRSVSNKNCLMSAHATATSVYSENREMAGNHRLHRISFLTKNDRLTKKHHCGETIDF